MADTNGKLFASKNKEFKIKYYPVIKDYMSGNVLNTPARIGHKTGIIEVSKRKFDAYTIPMRMIILLHEFSHKYKNPTMGLEISNEIGADINALYIYLGLGFSKIDAIHVFANVFLKAHILGSEGICFGGVYINILSLSVSPTFRIFSLVSFIVGMILFFISCKKVPNRTKYWVWPVIYDWEK